MRRRDKIDKIEAKNKQLLKESYNSEFEPEEIVRSDEEAAEIARKYPMFTGHEGYSEDTYREMQADDDAMRRMRYESQSKGIIDENTALLFDSMFGVKLIEENITFEDDFLTEGWADAITKYIPKVKGEINTETLNKVKATIANTYGATVEQWNSPESINKRTEIYNNVSAVIKKIFDAGVDVLRNPAKLKILLGTLDLGKYAALLKGVWDLIFTTTIDIDFFAGSSVQFGGLFYFKLALFLFGLKLILSVIGKTITMMDVIKGISGFVKQIIGLFRGNNTKENPDDEQVAEATTKMFDKLCGVKVINESKRKYDEVDAAMAKLGIALTTHGTATHGVRIDGVLRVFRSSSDDANMAAQKLGSMLKDKSIEVVDLSQWG